MRHITLRYLTDTDWIIHALHGNAAIIQRLEELTPDGIGNIIADLDILIGCTAIRHGLTLLSNNRRHFERLQGLNIISV